MPNTFESASAPEFRALLRRAHPSTDIPTLRVPAASQPKADLAATLIPALHPRRRHLRVVVGGPKTRVPETGFVSHDGCAPLPPRYEDLISVDDAVARYRGQVPDAQWAEISTFVTSAVQDANPATGNMTRRFLTVTARHVQWAWQQGYPLDRQIIFRAEVISEFVLHGASDVGPKTMNTYRCWLLEIADALLTGPHKRVRVPTIQVGPALAPYTDSELGFIRAWALNQRTEFRRVNATVLLALGLGAGLSTQELCGVRAEHIKADDLGVLVSVTSGPRARTVPVLQEWEEPLAVIGAAAIDRSQFVFAPRRRAEYHRNMVANFIKTSAGLPFAITVTRLRTTWIVQHLAEGTPVSVVAQAAGLQSASNLAGLLVHVPGYATDVAAQMLRTPPARRPAPPPRRTYPRTTGTLFRTES